MKNYTDKYGEFFGRINDFGTVDILHVDTGEMATRLDADVYPVIYSDDDEFPGQSTSHLSARYEYPQGIQLRREDADRIGILIEE